MSQPEAVSSPAPAEQPGRWEDFIDIFYAPSQVFRRRADQSFFVPLLIITVLMAVIMLTTFEALRPLLEADIERQMTAAMQRNPQMTPEMLERSRNFMVGVGKWTGIFVTPILIMIVGALTWLCGKFFGSRQTFLAGMVVATYAWVPRVLGGIIGAVQALLFDTSKYTSMQAFAIGPSRFLDPVSTSPVTMALAMRLDLWTIWATVLIGIGLYVTGRMSKLSATSAAILVWVLASIPTITGALRAAG